LGVAAVTGRPGPGRLVTAAALLAHAQDRLAELPPGEQAHADRDAEELRALLALRGLPPSRPVLLGFACGVAELTRLLAQLDEPVAPRTRKQLGDELVLLAGRLAQSSVAPGDLEPLWHIDADPSASGGGR